MKKDIEFYKDKINNLSAEEFDNRWFAFGILILILGIYLTFKISGFFLIPIIFIYGWSMFKSIKW